MATELVPTPSGGLWVFFRKEGKNILFLLPQILLTSENSSIPLGARTHFPPLCPKALAFTSSTLEITQMFCLFKYGFSCDMIWKKIPSKDKPFASRGPKHPPSCWQRGYTSNYLPLKSLAKGNIAQETPQLEKWS